MKGSRRIASAMRPHQRASWSPIRLLLVDDDALFLSALADLVADEPAIEVIATATGVGDALKAAVEHLPDIALIDVQMPDGGGERLAREIRRCAPASRVIAYSAADDGSRVKSMLDAGAEAFLVKGQPGLDIVSALLEVGGRSSLEDADQALSSRLHLYSPVMFREAPIGMMTLSVGLRPRWVNRSARHMLGGDISQLLAASLQDLVHPQDWSRWVECLDRLRGGAVDTAHLESRYLANGHLLSADVTVTAIRSGRGRLCGFQTFLVDIGERREVEEALHESEERLEHLMSEQESQARLMAGLEHDLRAPLTSVIGYAELLTSGDLGQLSDTQRACIAAIQSGGQNLLELVNELLDLARLRAGKLDLRLEPVHVSQAVTDAVLKMAPQTHAKHIGLTIHAQSAGCAMADPRRVRQILINLLSNAIKFTPSGAQVSITATRDDGQVRIAVTDSGPGIPPEETEHIFEEFVQVNRESAHEGTGLGLAISRSLARVMGGDVAVSSVVSCGSTFTLLLPEGRGDE